MVLIIDKYCILNDRLDPNEDATSRTLGIFTVKILVPNKKHRLVLINAQLLFKQ